MDVLVSGKGLSNVKERAAVAAVALPFLPTVRES